MSKQLARIFYRDSVRHQTIVRKLINANINFSQGTFVKHGATRVAVVVICRKGKAILKSIK